MPTGATSSLPALHKIQNTVGRLKASLVIHFTCYDFESRRSRLLLQWFTLTVIKKTLLLAILDDKLLLYMDTL